MFLSPKATLESAFGGWQHISPPIHWWVVLSNGWNLDSNKFLIERGRFQRNVKGVFVSLHKRMKKTSGRTIVILWIILFVIPVFPNILFAQPTLTLYSTINSIGYKVSLPASFNEDRTLSAHVRYREVQGTWQEGFPPTLLTIDSIRQFRGSAFMLKPGTSYDLMIIIDDSLPSYHEFTLTGSITTHSEPVITGSSNIHYVSPTGVSTLYTRNNPGNLKALLAGGLTCGETVIFLEGTYDIGEISLSLKTDCTESTPIIFMAEPGKEVIFDAGDTTKYQWVITQSDPNIYTTSIKPELSYNALCMLDSVRLYPYAFLTSPSIDTAYPSLLTLGYDQSGFYRNANRVYIKTLDHVDPNISRTIFSKYFWCWTIDGGSKDNYLYLKGITFRYYNKGKSDIDIFGNPTASYPSWTLKFTNANHIVIDSCKFLYTNFPLVFEGKCNYSVIQNSEFTDGTGYWSHGAFKQTRDVNYLEPGSYGRYLENSGVFFSPGDSVSIEGNIIRHNYFRGIVSAVGLGFGQNFRINEFDINDNIVDHCYDGIDPTAACINSRVWNNQIGYCPVGISLILPTFGPTYIFRNVIHHIAERKNHNHDVFFLDCNEKLTDKIWGTALKLNTGDKNAHPGYIYFMQNTLHSVDSLGFNMYLWNPTWAKLFSRNNIFYSEADANFMFDGIGDYKDYSFESQSDDYFNTRSGTIGIVRPNHGIASCETAATTSDLQTNLRNATTNNDVLVEGLNLDPSFIDASRNDFHLSTQSPVIDKGAFIPGINSDFSGAGPDLGAYETSSSAIVTFPISGNGDGILLFPNPAEIQIELSSKEKIKSALITDVTGIIIERRSFSETPYLINISALPSGAYSLKAFGEKNIYLRKFVKY
jgi:hypothetical protein